MSVGFVLLTCSTAFNIVADKGGKAGPPEFGGNELMVFEEVRVAGGLMVMAPFKDGMAEGVIGRDIDTAL